MAAELIAREDELRTVARFLDGERGGSTALVLEGEAGIGKSTLWATAIENARDRNISVLSFQAAEAEQGLAFAGLGDLLEPELDRLLPALPPPRRRALEVALLLDHSAEAIDPRAVAVATRNVLEQLSADGPLLVAIDDVQWLDVSSAAALSFALRRMADGPTRVLLARRLGDQPERRELERAVGNDRVDRLRLDPLSLGATQRLLQMRLGRSIARPTLVRIHEASGGNPFYALEIGRLVRAEVDPTRPLPIPKTLEGLLGARFRGLPQSTCHALLLVAAAGHPAKGMLDSVGVEDYVLEPAVSADLVEWVDDTVRFTHPMLASALYQRHRLWERREAHRKLALADADPVGRARHFALSTTGADEKIAAIVDSAADAAASRGAPFVAAELAEHAVRLTPADAEAILQRRKLALVRAHVRAGDGRRAFILARKLVAAAPAGQIRAEALIALSEVEYATGGSYERAIVLRREALRETGLSVRTQAELQQWLGDMVRLTDGLEVAEAHARTALRLAEELDDDALRAGSLSVLAVLRFNGAEPGALRLAEEAFERAVAAGDTRQRHQAAFGLAHILVWSLEHERARALLQSLYSELSPRDELQSATVLWYLSLLELLGSRFEAAADYAHRVEQLYLQYTIDEVDPTVVFLLLLIAAHVGDFDRANELAERFDRSSTWGLVKFWRGHAAEAVECFATGKGDDSAIRDPTMTWVYGEYAEALLRLGRIEAAVELLDRWEEAAVRVGRSWALARITRGRGLVAAARGHVDEAQMHLERAVEQAVDDPFGRARALLSLGTVRRRARQKRAARDAIEAALEAFERMGAAGWAITARGELGGIGGRTRAEGLSPAERRVAELVANGRTNREVAAALVLGERTVETHLTHIYAKLGVRSRTELARTLQPSSEPAEKS
jgi:DNA-binding CsgD family transcriptional regulator